MLQRADDEREGHHHRYGPSGMPDVKDDPRHHYGPNGVLEKEDGFGNYGPDGMPLTQGGALVDRDDDGNLNVVYEGDFHHGIELEEPEVAPWYQAESNRVEQEGLALRNFRALCQQVDQMYMSGLCPTGRWTNDPAVFPDLGLGIVPFPPAIEQLYIANPPADQHQAINTNDGSFWTDQELSDMYKVSTDMQASSLLHVPPTPFGAGRKQQPWIRLVDYDNTTGGKGSCICKVFDDTAVKTTHCGGVLQGDLDNSYLVEALNAISCRPKLARRMFHYWDVDRSIYILRLFKNGCWMRVEIDDYVPGAQSEELSDITAPFACRSQHWPLILWPTLVEKAYAKITTIRHGDGHGDSGGWCALGGGGRVEEALADMTGGVGGRFSTRDVSPDRLFVYMYNLQRDTLFVCRVHYHNCIKRGIGMDHFYAHVVNRCEVYETGLYVQVYTPSPRGVAGDFHDFSVPDGLWREKFPEQRKDGFYWMDITDFHHIFDTIFECRLVNSPDVGLPGMPFPRLPTAKMQVSDMVFSDSIHAPRPFATVPGGQIPPGMPGMRPPGSMVPPMTFPGGMMPGAGPPGMMGGAPAGPIDPGQPVFFEFIYANQGIITEHCPPEFTVRLPEVPCEVVACLEQTDHRIVQVKPTRKPYAAVLLKVYENVRDDYYSRKMVCKSNWMHIRDSMIAFKSNRGGNFKVIAEIKEDVVIDSAIFRCYISAPASVNCSISNQAHRLVEPEEPPKGLKWSFVGVVRPERLPHRDQPEPLDTDPDELRRLLTTTNLCPTQ